MQRDAAELAPSWSQWLAASVGGLQQRSLFRTLRPTVPGLSAVEVGAQAAAQLGTWRPCEPAEGVRPLPQRHPRQHSIFLNPGAALLSNIQSKRCTPSTVAGSHVAGGHRRLGG